MNGSNNFLNRLKAKAVIVESIDDLPIGSQESEVVHIMQQLQDIPKEPISEKAPVIVSEESLQDDLEGDLLDELNDLIYGDKPSKTQARASYIEKVVSGEPVISGDSTTEDIQDIEDGLTDVDELLDDDDEDLDDDDEDRFSGERTSKIQETKSAHDIVVEEHKKDLAKLNAGLPGDPDLEWVRDYSKRKNITEFQALEIWKRDTQKNQDVIDQAVYKQQCAEFKSKYQFTDATEKTGLYLSLSEALIDEFKILQGDTDPIRLEKVYDHVYYTLKDRAKRTNDLLKSGANNDAALKRESEKAFKKAQKRKAYNDKKAYENRLLSGQEVGDKRSLQEAKQKEIDGYEMGLNASDIHGESDERKMPETEFYYWEVGMDQLNKTYPDSLEVVYSGNGRFGGIEFGWKQRFPFLKGLDNSDIYYYQSATHCEKSLIDTLYALPGNARTFWMQLFNGSPNQSRISKFAPYVSNLKKHKTHSITGKHTAWKVIPPIEAFDEKVQKLDPYELLSLLPRAEADTFLIHLGRIVYGTNKTHVVDNMSYRTNEVLESKIAVPYRTGVVLHGDRNIGKSQLIELIVQALTLGGFSTRSLGVTFNQFGRKPLTTADLAYIDDAVDRKVVQALSDGHLKTTMSGGTMDVEDKGKDGEERIARAALIFAINRLCFPNNFDTGVAHRFHFLQIHSEQQMNEMSARYGKNMIPAALWERLSKELDVDIRLFGLYLLRRGIERYLEVAGLELQEDGMYAHVRPTKNGKPGIEIQLEENRSKYTFQPPVEEKEYICSMSRRCFAITKYLEPSYLDVMHKEYDNSFHAFTLLHTGNIITRLQNEIDECDIVKAQIIEFGGDNKLVEWQDVKKQKLEKLLHWIDPKGMVPTAIWIQLRRFWQLKALSGQSIGDSKKFTLEAIWDEFASLITTFDGRPIEPVRYEWTPAFLSAKNNTQGFLTEIQAMMDEFVGKLTETEITKLKRVATPFGYPVTTMTKDEIHFKDI